VNKYEPDIIAHLDIVKKNNHKDHLFYENSGWYRKMIFNTLDSIEKTSTIMEVNLGGINRGYTNEPYPSFWILRECAKRDIPIVINSDAHDLKGLQIDFSGLIKELKLIGYNGQMKLISGKWEKSYF
jgi:histidinol-phosphatase (PHP family)